MSSSTHRLTAPQVSSIQVQDTSIHPPAHGKNAIIILDFIPLLPTISNPSPSDACLISQICLKVISSLPTTPTPI